MPADFVATCRTVLRFRVFAPFAANVAASAGEVGLFSEVVLYHQAAALGLIFCIAEYGVDPFLRHFLAAFVAFGRDAHVGSGQPLFGKDQHRAAVAGDVADYVQLPQLPEQFVYVVYRVAGELCQLLLVDRDEVAEQTGVLAQQHGEDMVEFAPRDSHAVKVVALHDKPDARRVVGLVGKDQVTVLLQDFQCVDYGGGEEFHPCREFVDVECESAVFAFADGHLQIVEQPFVNGADRVDGWEFEPQPVGHA